MIDMLTGGDGAQTEEVISEDSIEEAPGVPENVGFVDLPEILVNLNTGAGKQSYLKIRVSLEVADQAMLPQVEQMMPRIVDNFQVYSGIAARKICRAPKACSGCVKNC